MRVRGTLAAASKGMNLEPLSSEDSAWLRMDSATNPMVVDALVELAEPLSLGAAAKIVERIGALPRFSCRVVETSHLRGAPAWEPVPGFRAKDHAEYVELDVPNDDELRALVGEKVGLSLDRDRPLWKIWFIDRPAHGTSILCRVHHALADGFALLGVLASLCDGGADAIDVAPHRARGLHADDLRGSARALTHLVTSPADPQTILKHAPGTVKRVAWSEPIPLADVKAIARRTSATVNDVLVAIVTGALARELERRGDPITATEIHAMLPVNLRPEGQPTTLGNVFGLVIVPLPIGVFDPLARIHAVKERMEAIKATPEAGVAHGMLRLLGRAPKLVEDLAVSFFGTKTSLVLTNVPGPRKRVSLGGVPVNRIVFWVPQASRMGLGISIFSYAGEITIGVLADTAVLSEPASLVADLHAELAALQACLRSAAPRSAGAS